MALAEKSEMVAAPALDVSISSNISKTGARGKGQGAGRHGNIRFRFEFNKFIVP
jgi:hypothetical protein